MAGAVNREVTPVIDEILQGSGKITANGVDLGSYQGGVVLAYSQTEVFVKSDWALGDVDSEITGVEATINTELEQATLENLALAYGINTSSVSSNTSSKVLELIPEEVMREVQLVFQGMSGTNRELIRTYTFYKCVRVGSTSMTLNRGVKTTIPVQFRCMLNSSGSFGTMSDATISA